MHPTSSRVSCVSRLALLLIASAAAAVVVLACGSESPATQGPAISLGDSGFVSVADPDAAKPRVDGGFVSPDGVIRADRFITKVVSFTPGTCSGFGASELPEIIAGPPVGAGTLKGGFDVVSLGIGGEIVVAFEPNAIVDGPGNDFIVFENAFFASGESTKPVADLGEVSVSEDGVTWKTFPCAPPAAAPYGACAGWHPVRSAPGNGISPLDPTTAGGEAYDLSEVALETARFVRIRDLSTGTCEGQPKPINLGFDLDAIALIHAQMP